MASEKLNHGPVVAAMVAASLLMLVGGFIYRALAVPTKKTPIDSTALVGFPQQVGSWTGQDIPLNDAIVRATETDAHINRRYSRHNDSESISLYVACGVRADEVMGHYPGMCYISAGWTLVDRQPMELPLNDGTKLPCSIFEFMRGGLDVRRLTVLHYFIVDEQCYGDISQLRSMAWHRFARVNYLAQVQIVASSENLAADSSVRIISAFAVDSASAIASLFEGIAKNQGFRRSRTSSKGK